MKTVNAKGAKVQRGKQTNLVLGRKECQQFATLWTGQRFGSDGGRLEVQPGSGGLGSPGPSVNMNTATRNNLPQQILGSPRFLSIVPTLPEL